MRRVLQMAIALGFAAPTAAWAAGRTCQPPQIDVATLYGKTPREVRGELSPLVGAPLAETNQLPDGGTFARLDSADTQDGVTQRYAWGAGNQGFIEVVYQRGRAQLVSLRLEEFESLSKGIIQPPCTLLPRDALAQRAGIFSLPRKASSTKATRGLSSYRFDVHLPGKSNWTVRMRCQSELCADVNVYFPSESNGQAPRPQEETTLASAVTPEILPPASAPETFAVSAAPAARKAATVAKPARRPLRAKK